MQGIAGMGLLGVRRPLSLREAERISAADTSTGRSGSVSGAEVVRRDAEGAVWITAAQARRRLPDGRYRFRDSAGQVTTCEVGESWCAEGVKLQRLRAVKRRLERQHAAQTAFLAGVR